METNKEKSKCCGCEARLEKGNSDIIFNAFCKCSCHKPFKPQVDNQQEIREEFRKYCNTDNFSAPPYETNIIADWWLNKLSQAIEQNEAKTRLEISSEISKLVLKTTDIKTMNVLEDLQKLVLEGINHK